MTMSYFHSADSNHVSLDCQERACDVRVIGNSNSAMGVALLHCNLSSTAGSVVIRTATKLTLWKWISVIICIVIVQRGHLKYWKFSNYKVNSCLYI